MPALNHLCQIRILFQLLHEFVHRFYHQNLHWTLPTATTGRSNSFNLLEFTILQIPLFISWSKSVVNSETFGRVPPIRFLCTWRYISLSRLGVTAFNFTFPASFPFSSKFLINPHRQARRTCASRGNESRIDVLLSRKNWNNVFDIVAMDTVFSSLTIIHFSPILLLNPSGAVSWRAVLHTSSNRRASPISAIFFTQSRIAGSWNNENSVPKDSLHSWTLCRIIRVKSASEYVGKTRVPGLDDRIFNRGRERSIKSILFAMPMIISTLEER